MSEACLLLIRVLSMSDLSGLPKWGTLGLQVFTVTMWLRSTSYRVFVACSDNVHCLYLAGLQSLMGIPILQTHTEFCDF